MKLIKSLSAKIGALFGSIAHPAAPVATTTAPHIRALLLHLCNQDATRALWLARWLAYPLRHPGAKMQSAVIASGVQGAGSSLLFERIIAPMYGSQALIGGMPEKRPVKPWALGMRYAVLMDLSPAELASSALKNIIASSNIVVHRAGVPDIAISNSLNVVLMTNDAAQLDSELDNRRLFTLAPTHKLPIDLAASVAHDIENGGLIEFHQYLTQELDMGAFDQYTSPCYAVESAVAA